MCIASWEDVPNPLYKHMEERFALKLLRKGELRVGTLFNFRKEEEHGSVIGDSEEGRYRLFVDVANGSDLPTPFREKTARVLDGAQIYNINLEAQSEDCHVLCFSLSADPRATTIDYDVSLEIVDFKALSWTVAQLLKERYGQNCQMKAATCHYLPRETHHSQFEDWDPTFVKPLEYQSQQEFRAAFCLGSADVAPINLRDARLAKCFRVVSGVAAESE
jgi:hypothetical protein